eukprot:gene17374-17846_t
MMPRAGSLPVTIAKRIVTVKGPRGELTRDFKHLKVDLKMDETGKKVKVDVWFGKQKSISAVKTVLSHIRNMMTGVTKGFKYKMRFAYAHFPVGVT